MDVTSRVIRFLAVGLLLAPLACGGEGDDEEEGAAQPQSSMIGPAGGTVIGPLGAKVVIPPGALASDTLITIEQTSAGAPALPAWFSEVGEMFAFTPHGTTFAVPVTITLPFDAAGAPDGAVPALYKTDAENQWKQVLNSTFDANSVSAEVTSFSYAIKKLGGPFRSWLVGDVLRDGPFAIPEAPDDRNDERSGFEVLDESYDFGPALMLDPSAPMDILPREIRATGRIFASEWGDTYAISNEAPIGRAREDPIGNWVQFEQVQSYIKLNSRARLTFKVTNVRLEAVDAGSDDLDPCTVGTGDPLSGLCDGGMESRIGFGVIAWRGEPSVWARSVFFQRWGRATLSGWRKHWRLSAEPDPMDAQYSMWGDGNVTLDTDVDQDDSGGHAKLELADPVFIEVDLSGVADLSSDNELEPFTVAAHVTSFVSNRRKSELSYLGAYFRDPEALGGSVEVITEGLQPIDTAPDEPSEVDPETGCVPDASAGTLQFLSPEYTIGEAVGASGARLYVMRTGGSAGEVTATVSTGDGTALAGADYVPVDTTVTFADGDTVPRLVNVPLLYSAEEEPDKTFDVTLSAPTGCASLGSPATVTILDDTRELPSSFTLGGTVSGLEGSGLVLISEGFEQPITDNGDFTFARPIPSGWLYDVRVKTQPTDPSQVCSVTRGKGTITDANVTDVAVNCTAQADTGGLDASFGEAGKVTTGLIGGAVAMALQSDGKIVLLGERTLARYDGEGRLDMSFGDSGQVNVVFSGGVQDEAQDLAIQADGMIVVAGFTRVGSSDDFGVVRYDADGSLDEGFGTGGKVSVDFSAGVDRATAVLVQPDGSIVVAGHASISSPLGNDNDFAVARFTSDGALDTSFGAGGKVTTNVAGRTDLAYAAALQADGKIVLAGRVADDGGDPPDLGLVRYNDDGSLDTDFGESGSVRLATPNTWDEAADLAIQGDDKIVAAGFATDGSYGFALWRFNADGGRDSGFGSDGFVRTALTPRDDYGRALVLQEDGKIVVVGQTSNLEKPDFGIVRYTPAGVLDSSFGVDGMLSVDFFGSGDEARDVALQADGRLVVSGTAVNGASNGLGLIRLEP
jgi:uncharacterized delta-60 repeat protein